MAHCRSYKYCISQNLNDTVEECYRNQSQHNHPGQASDVHSQVQVHVTNY